MKLSVRAPLLVIFLAVFFGCAGREMPEEAELKIVVARYNSALAEAYGRQSFGSLRDAAVEREVKKIEVIINAYLQAEQVMEAELHRVDFKSVKIEEDRADVKTSEDWKYMWVNSKTGAEVEPPKDIHYELLYRLVKKDGRWLVEKVEEVPAAGASSRKQSN